MEPQGLGERSDSRPLLQCFSPSALAGGLSVNRSLFTGLSVPRASLYQPTLAVGGLGCSVFKVYSHCPIGKAIRRFQGARGYAYWPEATRARCRVRSHVFVQCMFIPYLSLGKSCAGCGENGICWMLELAFQRESLGRDCCVTLHRSLHLSERFHICAVSRRWTTVSLKVREDSPCPVCTWRCLPWPLDLQRFGGDD